MFLHRVSNPDVKATFESYPQDIRLPLEELRDTIFEVAAALTGIGPIEESLKWGQPAYRPVRPRVGTTLRVGPVETETGPGYGLFVPCQTSLIADFRKLYRDSIRHSGNRALVFSVGEIPPPAPLQHFIAMALTYHMREVEPAPRRAQRIDATVPA